MLVLSRKVGEAIVIDHNTTVRVKSIRRGKVILTTDALDHIAVNREEVELRIQGEDKAA